MTDEQNWRFDVDDVGQSDENEADTSVEEESDEQTQTIHVDNSSQNRQFVSIISFFLLPISTISVYTFLKEGVILSVLTTLFGNSTVALAATKALWVIGFGVVGIISVAGIVLFLNALFVAGIGLTASQLNYKVALLGTSVYAIATASALTVFSTLPFLVGFVLALNLISVVFTLTLSLIGGVYATVMA
jgi:hypothetical protein